MPKTKVTIETKAKANDYTEHIEVDAYTTESPYFVIHRPYNNDPKYWTVTHVPSGKFLVNFWLLKDARKFVHDIKDLLDWSHSNVNEPVQNTPENFLKVREIAYASYCNGNTESIIPVPPKMKG